MKPINTYFKNGIVDIGNLSQLNQLSDNLTSATNKCEDYPKYEMTETLTEPGSDDNRGTYKNNRHEEPSG